MVHSYAAATFCARGFGSGFFSEIKCGKHACAAECPCAKEINEYGEEHCGDEKQRMVYNIEYIIGIVCPFDGFFEIAVYGFFYFDSADYCRNDGKPYDKSEISLGFSALLTVFKYQYEHGNEISRYAYQK